MDIASLLQELGARINLPGLALDETSRTCRLIFGEGEGLVVDIEALPGGEVAFLHATVAPLPASAGAPVFSRLLRANLFGQETDEASLGWDDGHEELVLFRRIDPARTDADAFVAAIERFVATLTVWRGKAAEELAGAAMPASPDPMPAASFAIRG